MNEIIPFKYGSKPVRVVKDDLGEPWFVAKDVCAVLEHTNSRMALQMLEDDEKGVSQVYTPGGKQEVSIVSEPGLYTLILRSDKPEAKPFRRWVTHTVLPAIRKTGGYVAGEENMTEEELTLKVFTMLKEKVELQRARIADQQRVIESQWPEAQKRDGAVSFTKALQKIDKFMFKHKGNVDAFMAWLRQIGILYKKHPKAPNMLTEVYEKYFPVRPFRDWWSGKTITQTLVDTKIGIEFLEGLVRRWESACDPS